MDKKYNREFPERFDWNSLDGVGSRTVCELAYKLSSHIMVDLASTNRIYTPGLRSALNHLYNVYEGMNQ